MFEQIRRFFARLFGYSTENQAATPPVSTRQVAPATIEDAADLDNPPILHIEAPEARTRGLETGRSIGTPSIFVGEVVDVHAGNAVSSSPVSITEPRFVWCLDNGHGRLQSGKRSPVFDDGRQFEEWEFNRDIVRRMIAKLDPAGVQYFNVVPEDEVGSFLQERVARANDYASPLGLPKLFVSIHSNAVGLGGWVDGTRGIETWHFPNNDNGRRIASAFQSALMEALPDWRDRGIKSHQAGSGSIFYVLRNTNMPAILTENGFYTDRTETALLMTDEIRQRIADAHVAAILHIEQHGFDNIPIYRPNMVVGG
ncbi:MAG: hypothetical protein OHK0039_34670 [Bacteroidia bacterium]